MSNVLDHEQQQQILALGRLGWTVSRIATATGVRRETVTRYVRAAGLAVRGRGRPGEAPAKAAISGGVSTDLPAKPAISTAGVSTDSPPTRAPQASACEPYRERIGAALALGRNATAIYQDLVDEAGFTARYASVRRFVGRLRGPTTPEARVVIVTAPGDEAQIDYGEGPMVRYPPTGKYRRARLFVLTLGYSRKAVRLLTWQSSAQIWAELHERAFRRLGGAPRVAIPDNLKEGVLTPDIYDPVLNPLYRDVLAHYGVVALPCRVGDPDRKGKVESGVGHAQKTPLQGLRFETLEQAQAYLDRWHRIADPDRPARTPASTTALLARAHHAGPHLHTVCTYIHEHEGPAGVRRILGVLALAKRYGPVTADDAAKAALELQVPTNRFLRRYLERRPAAPLTLTQVDPLIRQLTLYRDLIDRQTGDPT